MAKVSRDQLKGIVKECLLEILAEGLLSGNTGLTPSAHGKNLMSAISESSRRNHQSHSRSEIRRKPMDDTQFENAIHDTVSSLTKDTIMSSILHDTAKTTLQEQMNAERAPNPASLATPKIGEDIGSLFGDSAGRWAGLAFPEKKK